MKPMWYLVASFHVNLRCLIICCSDIRISHDYICVNNKIKKRRKKLIFRQSIVPQCTIVYFTSLYFSQCTTTTFTTFLMNGIKWCFWFWWLAFTFWCSLLFYNLGLILGWFLCCSLACSLKWHLVHTFATLLVPTHGQCRNEHELTFCFFPQITLR